VRSPVASVEFIRAGTGAVAKMDLSRFRLAAARGGVPTRKSVQILARFAVSFGRVTPKGQQLLPLSGNFLKSGTLRVLVYVVDQVCGFVRPGHPEGPATPPPQFELLPTGDAAILLPPV